MVASLVEITVIEMKRITPFKPDAQMNSCLRKDKASLWGIK